MYKTILLCFLVFVSLAQNPETSQWHFQNSGVSFLTNPPSGVTTSMSTIEGCASIADANGNLLFYTNGFNVWNSAHAIMPNQLGGSPSSVQSSLIHKKSGSEYYVFTTDDAGTGSFGYSIIDMSLAGGLGSVTATYTLSDSVAEKMTATGHCNGTDIWVLVHKMGNNTFEAYQAGPSGVNPIPVVSNLGLSYSTPEMFFGSMKFSPSGHKLGVASCPLSFTMTTKTFELFDFDISNGSLSNALTLGTYTNQAFSMEFSPDGSKLYGVCQEFGSTPVFQWDLCSANPSTILNSQTIIGASPATFRILQNARDGKIYFCSATNSLGVISSPNLLGSQCGFSNNVVYLGPNVNNGGGNLPNFLTSYFRQKTTFSPSTTTSLSCGSVTFTPLQFCAGASYTLTSYSWNFGDPGSGATNTSSLSNPVHAYPANGIYTVSLVSNYTCFSDTVVQTVTVTGLPTLSLTGKNNICLNESTTFTVSGASTYSWNNGALTSTLAVNPSTTTVYTVTGTDNNGCSVSKTLTLSVKACTGISNQEGTKWLELYPNPGKGIYHLELTKAANIRVTDISGRVLFEQDFSEGNHKIRLEEQTNGIYFLDASNSSDRECIKILKQE